MNNDNELFDNFYNNYETNENRQFYEESSKEIINKIKTYKSSAANKVLDLCCGTGILSELIWDNFEEYKILGVDISENMINVAKSKNIQGIKYFVCDANKLTCVNEELDIIASNYGVQWLTEAAFSEISRTLKDGGIFVCSIPGYTTGKVDVDREKADYVGNMFFKIISSQARRFEKIDKVNYAKKVIKVLDLCQYSGHIFSIFSMLFYFFLVPHILQE